jgi:hypothetical protein
VSDHISAKLNNTAVGQRVDGYGEIKRFVGAVGDQFPGPPRMSG